MRAEVTVPKHVKALAVVITILNNLYGEREQVLKTVASHFGYRLERL
jgi:hypothetical protein